MNNRAEIPKTIFSPKPAVKFGQIRHRISRQVMLDQHYGQYLYEMKRRFLLCLILKIL